MLGQASPTSLYVQTVSLVAGHSLTQKLPGWPGNPAFGRNSGEMFNAATGVQEGSGAVVYKPLFLENIIESIFGVP